MSSLFQYSVLQYSPSPGSGEVLNVGVVLLFPASRRCEARFPAQLKRLKDAFPNAPERTLRSYFRKMTETTALLNRTPDLWVELDIAHSPQAFLASRLLLPDASSLQFTPVRQAVQYHSDPARIANDYAQQLLKHYTTNEEIAGKGEDAIIQEYKSTIRRLGEDLFVRRKVQEKVIKTIGEEQYHFDFAWQNGRTNLVKAISFDLQRPDAIQRKGERFFGQLTLLQPPARQEQWEFNLLLAQPHAKALQKPFERAVNYLNRLEHTRLWVGGEGIQQYATQTAMYLLEHP